MTERYHNALLFSSCKRRKVVADFTGGDVTSNAGVILLRELDRRLKLTESVNRCIFDPRRSRACEHSQLALLKQRIYALALGFEDLNDHTSLRLDGAVQTAVDSDKPLASASTLCRLENRVGPGAAAALHEVLIEQFIASFKVPPRKLVLDFDATHDLVHGEQQGRYFNGFYDGYCFLPLYVFCGTQLLTCYLRPSSRGAAHHAAAVLKLLVRRLRSAWPRVRIVVRADAGFCKPLLLAWCDRHRVDYIIGIGKNPTLTARSDLLAALSRSYWELYEREQQHFDDFDYRARSWPHERRVLVKVEHSALGENRRYVVTSLKGSARQLYRKVYCERGKMENCIKEQKALFSDRTSCHRWWPNQFRVLLSGLAYVLMDALRRVALQGTALAKCQVDTLRVKLLKIGAVVLRNTRRIELKLSSQFTEQSAFVVAHARLVPG